MNLTDYLFDTPWWLPAAIAAAGFVVFYTANNRRETRLRTVGLVVMCLAALLVAVSYFVDTDLEKAEKDTRRLVDAFEARDWQTFRSLLNNNTSLGILNGITLYRGGDTIAARAKDAAEEYEFKTVNVTSSEARQDQTLITITLVVISVQGRTMDYPVTSRWEFDWLESADGWYLNEVRAVEIGRQQGQGMEGMFPGGRQ